MEKTITYIRTISPETRFVPELIKDLGKDLKKASYPEDDVMEIVLASDEALTNAILESAKSIKKKIEKLKKYLSDENTITVSWVINSERFSFTVIDQGGGFDLQFMLDKVPSITKGNFFENLKKYQEKNNLTIRENGKEIELKRFGAGLKIIMSFMDQITIDYINKKHLVSKKLSKQTEGTILNMVRYRNRKRSNKINE